MDYMTLICGGIKDAQQNKPLLSFINNDGTNVQIFNLTNKEMKTKKQINCKACDGSGKSETSNCCDAGYDSDMLMCYECHEHLGDEDVICDECSGTGKVEESYDDFQLRRTAEREGLISEMINEDDLIQD